MPKPTPAPTPTPTPAPEWTPQNDATPAPPATTLPPATPPPPAPSPQTPMTPQAPPLPATASPAPPPPLLAPATIAPNTPPPKQPTYESRVIPEPDAARTGTSSFQLNAPELRALPGAVDHELPDALRVLPGVTADALGQNHVRGNYADVRYWLDGVPMPSALSNQLLTLIPVELLANVELITGGMPIQYDGIGGVVAMTTMMPASGHVSYEKITYGSYNTVRPAAGYAQTIGRLSFLVTGSWERTDRGLDPPAATPIVHDETQTGQLLAKVGYQLTTRDKLEATVAFRQATLQIPIDTTVLPLSDAPPGAVRGTDGYGNDPTRFVPYDANPVQRERDLLGIVSYRHHGAGGDWLAAAIVRDSEGDLSCDPARSLGATADPGTICSDIRHRAQSYSGLLHYSRGLGAHQALKAGLQFGDEESSIGYTQYTRDDASVTGGVDAAQTITGHDQTRVLTFGPFVEDRFTWGALTLLAGLRYDLQAIFVPGQKTLTFDTPSGRLGANYALGRYVRLHAFVGYLWMPPSLDAPTAARALGLVPANQPLVLDVRPEETWSAEVGVSVRPRAWIEAEFTAWGRLMKHPLDDEEIGNTDLKAEYNYTDGRAAGLELGIRTAPAWWLTAFGNLSLEVVEGEGIATAKYLFDPDQLAFTGYQAFDHEQRLTGNLGLDVHDRPGRTHLDILVEYGSGLRTGPTNDLTLPQHATVDVSLRHTFDIWGQPEAAVDILNLFDELWAYRLGTASVVGSAYAPLRRISARLTWHL
jgi:outer membrane receptor protein involved in Fe transport